VKASFSLCTAAELIGAVSQHMLLVPMRAPRDAVRVELGVLGSEVLHLPPAGRVCRGLVCQGCTRLGLHLSLSKGSQCCQPCDRSTAWESQAAPTCGVSISGAAGASSSTLGGAAVAWCTRTAKRCQPVASSSSERITSTCGHNAPLAVEMVCFLYSQAWLLPRWPARSHVSEAQTTEPQTSSHSSISEKKSSPAAHISSESDIGALPSLPNAQHINTIIT